jgi:hypothetical protein
MIGIRLNTNYDQVRKEYLACLNETLENLFSHFPTKTSSTQDFYASVRAMSNWGRYPWRKFEVDKKVVTFRVVAPHLFLLPFYIFESIIYLTIKYFQYRPYKQFRRTLKMNKEIAFYSPSHHLKEFTDSSVNGFWGEVKYLSEEITDEGLWCLVPYKGPNTSHAQLAAEIKKIQVSSRVAVFPLASLLNLKLLGSAITSIIRAHLILLKMLFELTKSGDCLIEDSLIQRNTFGRYFAQTELNRHLIDTQLNLMKKLRHSVALMEGQSWEISLLINAKKRDIGCHSVIHTPLRENDSQVLNYFLNFRNVPLHFYLSSVLCPGESSIHKLVSLGMDQNKILLVEAQRFTQKNTLNKHKFDPRSNRILYVADANDDNTQFFFHELSNFQDNSNFEFFIQPHPTTKIDEARQSMVWSSSHFQSWCLVIFGPETSAFLQFEFSESNSYFLNKEESIKMQSPLRCISSLSQISSARNLPNALASNFKNVVNQDNEFPLWGAMVNELLKK